MRARIAGVTAAIAIAVPLAAAGPAQASPARAAAAYQLKIGVINRDGVRAAADVVVMNVATHRAYQLGTRSGLELSAGTYNVAGLITTGSGLTQTDTFADQVVDLDHGRQVVLDARLGNLVKVTVDNARAQQQSLELAPFVTGHWAFPPAQTPPATSPVAPAASLPVGGTYVVPMTSRLVTLYVYSMWTQAGSTAADPSPFRYDIVQAYPGGFPVSPVIHARTGALARVNVTARAFDTGQQAVLNLNPVPQDLSVQPLSASTPLGSTPARLVSYRSPGIPWDSGMYWSSQAGFLEEYTQDPVTYHRGTYADLWGAAVFAPPPDSVFVERNGIDVETGIAGSLWGDALGHGVDDSESRIPTGSLYANGKLIAASTRTRPPVFVVPLRTKTTSYTLRLSVARLAGAELSASISGVWQFTAGRDDRLPSRLYTVTLLPAGLNDLNQAAAGSRTTIGLGISIPPWWIKFPPRTVRVWASADDGGSWRPATVRKVHGRYEALVRNAAAAGFTSLRVYVADGHGDSEELTVLQAYGVR